MERAFTREQVCALRAQVYDPWMREPHTGQNFLMSDM